MSIINEMCAFLLWKIQFIWKGCLKAQIVETTFISKIESTNCQDELNSPWNLKFHYLTSLLSERTKLWSAHATDLLKLCCCCCYDCFCFFKSLAMIIMEIEGKSCDPRKTCTAVFSHGGAPCRYQYFSIYRFIGYSRQLEYYTYLILFDLRAVFFSVIFVVV